MTTHDAFLELAAAAIDFDLSADEREHLARHESGCRDCRLVAEALRSDARAMGRIPVAPLAGPRASEIVTAVLRPRRAMQPLRLVLVAALLALVALGLVAVGSELLRRDDLVVVPPIPTATAVAEVSPSAVPTPTSTIPPLDTATATWIKLGSFPGAVEAVGTGLTTVVGFDAGYAATGTLAEAPAAWSSTSGLDWTSTPLARSVLNCPNWGPDGPDMVPDAEHRAIATDGRAVVIVGEVGDYAGEPCGALRPVAWYSADGRTWQRSEPFEATDGDLRAVAVWATDEGWGAMSEAGLWTSADGSTWRRIGDLPVGLYAIAGAPDGRLLGAVRGAESEAGRLVTSADGVDWTDVAAPDACGGFVQGITPPAQPGRDAWIVVGDLRLCSTRDLTTWTETPMEAWLGSAVQTRYGAIVLGDTCYGAGATCEPDPRAWLLTDEDAWVSLAHPPVAFGRSLADGAGGVLMFGDNAPESSKDVWRLEP